jgi:hypothetical protein
LGKARAGKERIAFVLLLRYCAEVGERAFAFRIV